MLGMIGRLVKKWNGWVGNRDMEQAIRNSLSRHGLRGTTAQFSHVQLVAIQRPGWLQLYSFDAVWEETVSESDSLRGVFGLVRQDERFNRTEIQFFETAAARAALLEQWSEGLIRLR
jgi:hypothetical protein